MKTTSSIIFALLLIALPASAVDFLGVELCKGSTDTRVEMPPGSSLVLESVEIGDHGGLVMLLSARSGKVMGHVDDLMTGLTGQRGEGDGDGLEWSSGGLTAVAQRVAKKYAALAVTSTDDCPGIESAPADPPPAAAAPVAVESAADDPQPVVADSASPKPDLLPDPVVPVAAAATTVAVTEAPQAPEPEPAGAEAPDFEVIGEIAHEAADPTWVDVMGVVANHTPTGYRLATFDLSLYGTDDSLICVDTISVSVLKSGQERAFRDAIRCPGYNPAEVARIALQFSGGF